MTDPQYEAFFYARQPHARTVAKPIRSLISRISVRDLFGRFNYVVPHDAVGNPLAGLGRLILLYGDNGSGKTTILRLVYHLLSPAPRRGHRTAIARVPFSLLELELSNRTSIRVVRAAGEITGSFTIVVELDGAQVFASKYHVDDEGRVPPPRSPDEERRDDQYREVLTTIASVPYFLADDRMIRSDNLPDLDDSSVQLRYGHETLMSDWRIYTEEMPSPRLDVGSAVANANEWFRQLAYRGTRTGYGSANTIYLDVANRIAKYGTDLPEPDTIAAAREGRKKLALRLSELGQRNAAYEDFGLTAPFPGAKLSAALDKTPDDRVSLLNEVLTPYLDGLQARLDALREVERLLRIFTSTTNTFLAGKMLDFSLHSGLVIRTDDARVLEPAALSSGEKQLLLLLCSVLVARDQTTLYIIDEPELSLNVKWQRWLLDALLACSEGTNMQFLVATHSVEMIAGHSEGLATLTSI